MIHHGQGDHQRGAADVGDRRQRDIYDTVTSAAADGAVELYTAYTVGPPRACAAARRRSTLRERAAV